VKHYSSGMYVRLAFSVAAHLDTDIMLLDEVLSVGDLAFRTKSQEKMKSIARDGRTVILVSHDLVSITELCQRAILMSKGSILMIDDPKTVVAAHKEASGQPKDVETDDKVLAQKN
jgi:lipopolysaccharide transport system ATP-binding protein